MHTIELYWTLLTDTDIRRHNSNEKNVYRFSIYKCERTYVEQKLAIYKSFREHARVLEEELPIETTGPESINIIDCQTSGIKEVKIFIEHADIRYRMDKLLAGQLVGWSRTQIVQYIKSGLIRLNDRSTKPGTAVCTNDCIRILLDSL